MGAQRLAESDRCGGFSLTQRRGGDGGNVNILAVRNILEAFQDRVYIINQDYTMAFMNTSMVRDFGEGIGEKCYRVLSGRDKRCPWCKAEEVFKGGINRREEQAGVKMT